MENLFVIKIGGNIIDDESKLLLFLSGFAHIQQKKILVHGGGKLATRLSQQLGIQQQLIEGRRVTDEETLKVVTMVYAGYINKSIVARLQGNGCNAIGLSGADGESITAHKRVHPSIDYGFVGDVDKVNIPFFTSLLQQHITPVLSPITHDGRGGLLNTNADTIGQEIAKSLSGIYQVTLIYCFEKKGVLANVSDDDSVITRLNYDTYQQLKGEGAIFEGMIPKLDNAFKALDSGISKVVIGNGDEIGSLTRSEAGTTITHD